MSRPVPLRKDFNSDDLRRLSRSSTDAKQARRLLTISLIYDGATRSEAARHGNVDVQSIRDWVLRFNAEGPEGLIDKKSTGAPTRLNAKQMATLARVVEDGPVPYLDGIVRWRYVQIHLKRRRANSFRLGTIKILCFKRLVYAHRLIYDVA